MQSVLDIKTLVFILVWLPLLSSAANADEPLTLIGTIVKWRYPEANIGKSEMADAATIDINQNRTVPSTILKTTMTTPDSVEKVVEFYRELFARNAANDSKLGLMPASGRSVIFCDESEDRPFAFHTIVVNSENVSTTLVITRAQGETSTHITWKQYVKHDIGG